MTSPSRDLEFYKMSGAGNDFIVFDGFNSATEARLNSIQKSISREDFVRSICRRGLSVGADGVVFLSPSSQNDFDWDFYNSDGSSAEMCGNAARCVGALAFQLGRAPRKMKFGTRAGVIEAEFTPDRTVSVLMAGKDFATVEKTLITQNGEEIRGTSVNTGVPHFVLTATRIEEPRHFRELAAELRSHKEFGSRGTNVTFYEALGDARIRSVSFERGVEDFTLACGTGAVAAALVFAAKRNLDSTKEISVEVPGGVLFVRTDTFSGRPFLRGPATVVYVGNLNLGAIDGIEI